MTNPEHPSPHPVTTATVGTLPGGGEVIDAAIANSLNDRPHYVLVRLLIKETGAQRCPT